MEIHTRYSQIDKTIGGYLPKFEFSTSNVVHKIILK